ncbi:MAG: hypothetical protein A2275_06180 [Bacteroidetes bacterium RIFOXYA12_FULL_35_11]|nr:MAG: hypothetical protein A2X01_01745 [Bacteroidetes bacterium GWF2_35_48]OFY74205.1 MAG: hypothetical protein A2275_06180 [Bacteroidetes bacterium RIFOXYA12_FULL_35_11]OFY93781.1 MAG: hypothetical protein A2491_02570 [Bacteroidetes bacterium RIFOXYC12_FULL_35_7]HBX52394.1 hypothetical protein [Bacteroidales bacterium]
MFIQALFLGFYISIYYICAALPKLLIKLNIMRRLTYFFMLMLLSSVFVFAQTGVKQAKQKTKNTSVQKTINLNADVCTTFPRNATPQTSVISAPKGIMAGELLIDNGPLVTHPAGGPGGADFSFLEAPNTNYGFGHAMSAGYGVAEDFTITVSDWAVDSVVFFAYQTGSTTTSTMTTYAVRIWNGEPGIAGSAVVWGDSTTNVMTSTYFSGIYRGDDVASADRPIMRSVCATTGLTLTTGTYWVEWTCAGSMASGPWAPPVTISGQPATGNAKQRNGGTWANLMDGTNAQGLPFLMYGTAGTTYTNDMQLLSVIAPVSGPNMTATETVTIRVKNNGTADASNIPVSFTLNSGTTITEAIAGPVAAGATADYTFTATADFSAVQAHVLVAEVTLIGDEFAANNTKTVTITNMGNLIIMGSVTADTTCSGTFVDSGTLTGPYAANEDNVLTLVPGTAGDRIRVAFTAFNVESGYDTLYVYDGANATAPQITGSPFSSTTLPAALQQVTATNPAGAITFRFKSDGSVQNAGWEAAVSCFTPAADDVAVISIDVSSLVLPSTVLTPMATVKNMGTATQTFDVTMTIGGVYTDTKTVTALASAATEQVTFNTWTSIEGNYTITVEAVLATDGNTADNTLTQELAVQNIYIMGTNTQDTTCSGTFVDSGLLTAGYSASEDNVLTLVPGNPGDMIRISFTAFDIESGYDFLSVHDGIDVNAPQIAGSPFSGSTLPTALQQVTASNPAGALTFHFTSDGSGQSDGWEASISCFTPPADDIAVLSIDMPAMLPPGAVIPMVTVKNNGLNVQTFDVTMTITGGYTDTKTVTALASGASQQVSFNTWTAANGNYTIDVTAPLTGDANPNDNTFTQTISIQELIKAYGYVVYTDGAAVVNGPAWFYLQDPATINSIADQSAEDNVFSGCWADGKWYACTSPATGTGSLVYFDTTSGARTVVGPVGFNMTGITFDWTSYTMYAIVATATTLDLYTINYGSGAATQVGSQVTTTTTLLTLSADANGNLYALAADANLYSIDKVTAAVTLVGPTNAGQVQYAQDAEFDHDNTSLLWWAMSGPVEGHIFSINTAVGATATDIGLCQANAEICGFAIPSSSLVGVNSNNEVNIHVAVYPNPANSKFFISKPANGIVTVYNLQGEVVAASSSNETLVPFELNVANGTYLVKVQTGNAVVTKKITIVK